MPGAPLPLAGSPLDRAGHRRTDAAWLAAGRADPAARFVAVWRGRTLVRGAEAGAPAAALLPIGALPPAIAAAAILLGLHDGAPVFAADLGPLDAPPAGPGETYEDLWRVGGLMPPAHAAILGHARALVHWQFRHRFCGICGAATIAAAAGHTRTCQGCGATHFPRTDPAVIMLVTHQNRALLARSRRFRNLRVFSTLAGFVEPGESLEEAVAREVFEEAGVRVGNVRYVASQPWPFPGSIMLGFFAEASNDAITLDDDELIEAAWFTRDALARPEGFALPPPFSIARALIDHFLASAAPEPPSSAQNRPPGA